jgi:hypothetical protein
MRRRAAICREARAASPTTFRDWPSQCPDEDRVVRSARYQFERAVYEITAPEFDEVIIKRDPRYYSGKAVIVKVYNNSEDNCYIQKAELNGKPLNNCWFYHRDFVQGGTLEPGSDLSPTKNGEPIIQTDDRQRALNI